MKRFSRGSWLVAVALMVGAGASARAGALDDRVPQESILYVGWAGAEALGPQYAQSNLKGLLDASAIADFVNKQLPKLVEMAAARDPNAPKVIAKLQQGLGVAWRHPTAFYFCPLDYSAAMPGFRFGVICEAGADAKTVMDLLNEAIAAAPQNPFLPMRAVQEGATVMLMFGKADTLAELRKGGGLAAVPAYQAAMSKVQQAAPALTMYLDFTKGLATLNEGLAKIPNTPPVVKEKVPAALEALGLNSLTQMAMVSGFDGKGWSEHSYLGVNGPRKGIMTLQASEPLSDGALAVVPKDAAAFGAWKMDLHKAYTEARTVIGKIDAPTLKDFDAGVGTVNASLGLEVERDLLAPLGDEWIFYRAPISDEGGNSPALVLHLKDGATFAKSLAKLETLFNAIPNVPIKIEKVTAAKTEVSMLAFLQYSVAWGVKNDMLYISSLGGIGGAIKQVENKLPSVVENESYKAARAALPQNVKPVSISYTYPAKLYPELRRMALGIFPVIRQAGFDVPMELLPEGDRVAQFMPPGATIVWSEADGFHSSGKSAFPGAELLGGQQLGPGLVTGLAVGGMMTIPRVAMNGPAVASRNVDMANLRGVAQSSLVYASDHKEALPDDLARLVADGMISPKSLVSRRAGTTPLELTPELEKLAKDDFAKFSVEVAAHCDFVYLGKDGKSDLDAGVIMAYEKSNAGTPDGLNVAFRDGHVEFILWTRMPTAFEATNAALKKAGKAEVDVKALLRAGGFVDGAAMP